MSATENALRKKSCLIAQRAVFQEAGAKSAAEWGSGLYGESSWSLLPLWTFCFPLLLQDGS